MDTRELVGAAAGAAVGVSESDTKSLGDTKLSCSRERRVEGEGSFLGRTILLDVGGVLNFGVITCRLETEIHTSLPHGGQMVYLLE